MNQHTPNKNYVKHVRKYYEAGCLCIKSGEVKKLDASISDEKAALLYDNNCSCSRNFNSLTNKSEID